MDHDLDRKLGLVIFTMIRTRYAIAVISSRLQQVLDFVDIAMDQSKRYRFSGLRFYELVLVMVILLGSWGCSDLKEGAIRPINSGGSAHVCW